MFDDEVGRIKGDESEVARENILMFPAPGGGPDDSTPSDECQYARVARDD